MILNTFYISIQILIPFFHFQWKYFVASAAFVEMASKTMPLFGTLGKTVYVLKNKRKVKWTLNWILFGEFLLLPVGLFLRYISYLSLLLFQLKPNLNNFYHKTSCLPSNVIQIERKMLSFKAKKKMKQFWTVLSIKIRVKFCIFLNWW